MPMPKRPEPQNISAARERAQNRYIQQAGQDPEEDKRKQMLLEIDPGMWAEIDDARKPFGLSRSAWIRTAIREKLNRGQ